MRVVVDTNVLVSAILFRSSQPAIVLRRVLQRETLLISQAIFEEWHKVLSRPKFDRYVVEALRTEFLETILNDAVWIEI